MDRFPIPIAQTSFASFVNIGLPSINIPAFVVDQTPAGAKLHGWGVNTPIAAAVAAATCGFIIEEHIPKEDKLTSITVAIGFELPKQLEFDETFILHGTVPNGQVILAPLTTTTPILICPFL